MSAEEISGVRQANRAFYEALGSRSVPAMEACWAHDDAVACIHPGWHRLDGWDQVLRSWIAVFRNSRPWTVACEDERIFVAGDFGVALCVEKIETSAGEGEPARMQATNVYRRVSGEWKMVHHHASPSPEVEADEAEAPVN
jgi:ketosteroid isomerase-like protein